MHSAAVIVLALAATVSAGVLSVAPVAPLGYVHGPAPLYHNFGYGLQVAHAPVVAKIAAPAVYAAPLAAPLVTKVHAPVYAPHPYHSVAYAAHPLPVVHKTAAVAYTAPLLAKAAVPAFAPAYAPAVHYL